MANDDGLDFMVERFMEALRREYRGHKSEITAHQLTKMSARFANLFGIKEAVLLDALIRRDWLEPIGSNSYAIHFDKMRR